MAGVKHSIFWWDTEPVEPGPPLSESVDCDICIIGAGYTGMWTAWFLKEAEPSLNIHIVESDWAGAGASGHNDGYATTLLGMSLADLVGKHGVGRAGAAHKAVARSVVEIGNWCEGNGLDAEYEHNGVLAVATNPGQLWRLERDYEAAQSIDADRDFELLDTMSARDRLGSPSVQSALRQGSGALLNPLKLARGLARALQERGVIIHEQTPASEVRPASSGVGKATVITPQGTVSADTVIVTTNAYQHRLRQFRRKTISLWSYAMVSEPLTEEQLNRVSWPGREGFEDKRNYITIGRLTQENRVLWAGRLAPYFFRDDMDLRHMNNRGVHDELRQAFYEFFPMWQDVQFSHAYGGCVAITATFLPYFGSIGGGVLYGYGYNGHGVAPSHTGGKVLRDLALRRDTEYTELLFVNSKEPRLPPEPIRFLGAKLTEKLLGRQDRRFDRGKGAGEMNPLVLRLINR